MASPALSISFFSIVHTDFCGSVTSEPHINTGKQKDFVSSTAKKSSELIYKVKVVHPYSITERRVPELIPVLRSQPAGDVSHKPGGRLPLLSARLAVTPATLTRAATNFAVW